MTWRTWSLELYGLYPAAYSCLTTFYVSQGRLHILKSPSTEVILYYELAHNFLIRLKKLNFDMSWLPTMTRLVRTDSDNQESVSQCMNIAWTRELIASLFSMPPWHLPFYAHLRSYHLHNICANKAHQHPANMTWFCAIVSLISLEPLKL